MKIYLVRHGRADWPNWEGSDDDRPLTKAGKKEMRQVGRALAAYDVAPDLILSSPLPRARQTAKIAAKKLGLDVADEDALRPGFDQAKLAELVARYSGRDIMLVGHNPDFTNVVRALTGASIEFAKAGIARVDLDDPTNLNGSLVWLIPPDMLI